MTFIVCLLRVSGELSMSFDTMERNRTAKKNKPRLDASTGDLCGDLGGMSGLLPILPTPSLKTLPRMDYRPPEPVFSPPTTAVPVPSFNAGFSDPLGETVPSVGMFCRRYHPCLICCISVWSKSEPWTRTRQ